MTTCPLCQHKLYHQSPPLLRLPPLRVYCDGCRGWLAWQPTDETQLVRAAPICQACNKPMVLKSLKAGGLRYGCETWKECKTGMRSESAKVVISVPVYELVARVVSVVDEDATHYDKLYQERSRDWARIEALEERRKVRFGY